jgi:predicted  nucleic acid-binding Zn-ribbon protein
MGLKILIDILLKDTETMTDERFNHLEAQITELREFVRQSTTTMQENTAAMQQDLNLMREDMTALRERVNIIEESVAIEIRSGFNSLRNHIDDLNLERSEKHHNPFDEDLNQRRLNRRIPAFDKREDD